VNAYTSNLAKENNKNFVIRFKKKKAPSDSIAIYAKNYKSKGVIFPTFFGKEPIKSAEQLPDKLEYDARLVRKRLGHFYLCIPKKLDKYNGPSQNKVIAFDPGMRTFCSKKFKCPGCNQESDRDFNAARNILLKNMSLIFRD
jgi:transposase